MTLNERKLIKRSMKGDIDAFEKLIEAHQKSAYNIALRMLKNPEDAKDVSQQAFVKIFKYIDTFNFKSSFTTWMYRIIVNLCIDYINKNKINNTYSLDNPIKTDTGEINREVKDNTDLPEDIVEKKETKQIVHNAINKLDDIHRSIIILRDIEDFSYKEISEILEISIGTVKSRIKRGRDNLRVILKEEMEQNPWNSV
ncbi:sigma-70 family RNA polymerase sigma factor [Clostridium sp. D2Q-11]|uniref:Sigma-70 family RNA polymerase sigma factor n=1 Tax=Anaeromonas frigoriresistens TaxID=2683708 RepID=A0A942Z7F3_9FIRM|nr:sigma-70 family RNA polymerase sigma factor [Anaeromonas frigoriresistens]MBS4537203.1 sigma-70 family RNA polymerase sigma factor [Anaeromonas frigoriresistens]